MEVRGAARRSQIALHSTIEHNFSVKAKSVPKSPLLHCNHLIYICSINVKIIT